MQTHTKIDVQKFIDDCINEYKESSQGNGLFNTDGTYFWSESLLNRMYKMENVREKRSEAGKKSAEKRWGKKEEKKRVIKRPKIDRNNKNITNVKKFITNVIKNNNNVMRLLRKNVTKNNKIKENIHFIKGMNIDVEMLIQRSTNTDVAESLKKLSETIKYSDPITNPIVAVQEQMIMQSMAELKNTFDSGDMAQVKVLCATIETLFIERNKKLMIAK